MYAKPFSRIDQTADKTDGWHVFLEREGEIEKKETIDNDQCPSALEW